ncbi:hypothetical protein PC117_g26359 [Phytophthora cactorum]|uniref:Uncharacterized protein n=1 Tax=Phytophthora cactorum TaxID=29920 RepID=A0A8T1ALM1_9STRA|nr:hypothetical protein PC117_g26359 [Phytophthora cactorum]
MTVVIVAIVVFAVAVGRGLGGLCGVLVFETATIVRVVMVVVVLMRVASVVLVGAELTTRSHSRWSTSGRETGVSCLQDGGSDTQAQFGNTFGVHLEDGVTWLRSAVG